MGRSDEDATNALLSRIALTFISEARAASARRCARVNGSALRPFPFVEPAFKEALPPFFAELLFPVDRWLALTKAFAGFFAWVAEIPSASEIPPDHATATPSKAKQV
jgi:hypothetical protein